MLGPFLCSDSDWVKAQSGILNMASTVGLVEDTVYLVFAGRGAEQGSNLRTEIV